MRKTLIKNAKIVTDGVTSNGDILIEGDIIKEIADYVIEIPATDEPLTPLLSVVPLQLLSYHIAIMRGCDVDQPRNLAKSVTVE